MCHFNFPDQKRPVFSYCRKDIIIDDITKTVIRVNWDRPLEHLAPYCAKEYLERKTLYLVRVKLFARQKIRLAIKRNVAFD